MINLILNERYYAERLINGSILEENPYQALSILARYYCHIKGFTKKKIVDQLNIYLYDNYYVENFEKAKWGDIVEKIAKNARKYPLKEVNGISITCAEMETIDALPGIALRKLAFTILCLAKLGDLRNPKNNGWVNVSSKDVFELANINCRSVEREIKIGTLYKKGLLEFPLRNDNLSYRVTYINNSSDEVLFVDDLRELGYWYMNFHNGGYIKCRECGILMKDSSPGDSINRSQYCKKCKAPSPTIYKELKCIDCGNIFLAKQKDNKSVRCPYCKKEHWREYFRKYRRNERQMINSVQISN